MLVARGPRMFLGLLVLVLRSTLLHLPLLPYVAIRGSIVLALRHSDQIACVLSCTQSDINWDVSASKHAFIAATPYIAFQRDS
jgi:hypothetical protein